MYRAGKRAPTPTWRQRGKASGARAGKGGGEGGGGDDETRLRTSNYVKLQYSSYSSTTTVVQYLIVVPVNMIVLYGEQTTNDQFFEL